MFPRTLLSLLCLSAFAACAHAQTTRTIAVDPIGEGEAASGCTLREAIDVANAGVLAALGCTAVVAGSGAPVRYAIHLPAYTYVLAGVQLDNDNLTGDLDLHAADVTILGAGSDQTIVDGGAVDRIFHVIAAQTTLSIGGLTLRNGKVTGAGGFWEEHGGAIYNKGGVLNVSDAVFLDNMAVGATPRGGAVRNDFGTFRCSRCSFVGNSASFGGAVMTAGTPSLGTDSMTIVDSRFRGNEALGGGAIQIGSDSGNFVVSGTLFASNSALVGSGGAISAGAYGVGPLASTLSIVDSVMVGNVAHGQGGALLAATQANIANTSFLGNRADGSGGAIESYSSTQWLSNVTVAGNVADADAIDGGDGGGISRASGTVYLKNSVLADNVDASGGGPDCFGSMQSLQFNVVGKNQGCLDSFHAGSPNPGNDFVGTAAIPLESGLPAVVPDAEYLMPSSSSIAVDRIGAADCTFASGGDNPLFAQGQPVQADQRGTVRVAPCDAGAVEYTTLIFAGGFER